jgi:hypothetical protein
MITTDDWGDALGFTPRASIPEPTLDTTPLPPVWDAAFRLENDVANLMAWYDRPVFEPDQAFDWRDKAMTSKLYEVAPDAFFGVGSEAEWQHTERRVAQELLDRQAIEAAGWGGIGAAMMAGMLSPTVLLPAGAAARAKTVSSAVALAAGWGATSVGAQEIVLQMNQETRTPLESGLNIGAGAIFAGVLGGAIRYLDPLALERAAVDMYNGPGTPIIRPLENTTTALPPDPKQMLDEDGEFLTDFINRPAVVANILEAEDMASLRRALKKPANTGIEKLKKAAREAGYDQISIPGEHYELRPLDDNDASLSAARTPASEVNLSPSPDKTELIDPGNFVGTQTALGRLLTLPWLGPVSRQAANAIPAFRWAAAQISSGGAYRQGNLDGRVSAQGGDVESRVLQWQHRLVNIINRQHALFNDYWVNAKKGSAFRARFAYGARKEFSNEIGKAFHMRLIGQQHPVPEVNKAVDIYLEEAFGPAIKEAVDLDMPGYKELNSKEQLLRAQQMIKADLGGTGYLRLEEIVRENALLQLRTNPKVMENKALRAAIGLDLDFDKLIKAKELGQIADLNELADKLTQRIMDNFSGQFNGSSMLNAMQDSVFRGKEMHPFIYIDPFKTWSNGERFVDYLETNQEAITRNFMRKIGPDIELFRTFGVTDPRTKEGLEIPFWQEARQQMKEAKAAVVARKLSPRQQEKELAKIDRFEASFRRDFEIMVGRIKHDRGLPDDPTNAGFRMGRALLNLNVARMMGGVVLQSIPDLSRPVLKYGFMTTFRESILGLLSGLKELKMTSREAMYSGAADDLASRGRSTTTFDILDDSIKDKYSTWLGKTLGKGESYLQAAANNMGRNWAGMYDGWTTIMKHYAATPLVAMLSKLMLDEVEGTITPANRAVLRGYNLDEEAVRDIVARMKDGRGGSEIRPGLILPNTEEWAKLEDGSTDFDYVNFLPNEKLTRAQRDELNRGKELQRLFRAAVAKGLNDTIITPGVERPGFVDANTLGRLIWQFRSFTLSSHFKAFNAMRQEVLLHGTSAMADKVLPGIALGLGTGAISYYLWATAVGGDTQARMLNELEAALNGDEKALGRWADEAISRSGLLGVLDELRRSLERVPATQDFVTFGDSPTARSPFVNPVTETIGPWLSTLEAAGRVVQNADEPNSQFFRQLKSLLPFQNLFWLRQQLDNANEALMKSVGINPG